MIEQLERELSSTVEALHIERYGGHAYHDQDKKLANFIAPHMEETSEVRFVGENGHPNSGSIGGNADNKSTFDCPPPKHPSTGDRLYRIL